MIDREEKILASTREKYSQARSVVEKQNKKIASLQNLLQEEKDKNSINQEAIRDEKEKQGNNDCKNVDVSEKNVKEKVFSVRQYVGAFSALSPEDYKVSMNVLVYNI